MTYLANKVQNKAISPKYIFGELQVVEMSNEFFTSQKMHYVKLEGKANNSHTDQKVTGMQTGMKGGSLQASCLNRSEGNLFSGAEGVGFLEQVQDSGRPTSAIENEAPPITFMPPPPPVRSEVDGTKINLFTAIYPLPCLLPLYEGGL